MGDKERAYPLGLLPNARMNWRSMNAKYRYLRAVLKLGVTVSPKGQATLGGLMVVSGVPTRSMMTDVVSQ